MLCAGRDSHTCCAGSPEHRATLLVEEFMSIADGQAVLRPGGDGARPLALDCTTSLSRLGSRAYPPALKELAPKVFPPPTCRHPTLAQVDIAWKRPFLCCLCCTRAQGCVRGTVCESLEVMLCYVAALAIVFPLSASESPGCAAMHFKRVGLQASHRHLAGPQGQPLQFTAHGCRGQTDGGVCAQVRLELTQAVDAQRYAADGGGGGAQGGAARRTRLLEAALAEGPSGRCHLPEAAALLWLLVGGKLDSIAPQALWVRPPPPPLFEFVRSHSATRWREARLRSQLRVCHQVALPALSGHIGSAVQGGDTSGHSDPEAHVAWLMHYDYRCPGCFCADPVAVHGAPTLASLAPEHTHVLPHSLCARVYVSASLLPCNAAGPSAALASRRPPSGIHVATAALPGGGRVKGCRGCMEASVAALWMRG